MTKVVGDIAVSVGADISGLQDGMRRAGRSVDKFGDDFNRMAARVATIGTKIAAAAGAAAIALGTDLAVSAVKTAKEIQNLSNIARIGVEDFQRIAYAAGFFGVEQEKLADILKDTNDKFGDFMANGAGPLKDFFDNIAPKVGVTAEQFARLSGPEALQLYVSSLEKAGVSQQEMTFYLEALASDASALVPLLRDGGTALNDLAREAENAGAIIDQKLIGRGVELADKWRQIMNQMVGYTKQFALQAATMLDNAFGITDSGKIEKLGGQIRDLEGDLEGYYDQLGNMAKLSASSLMPGIRGADQGPLRDTIEATEAELNEVNGQILKLQEAALKREAALNAIAGGQSVIEGGGLPKAGGKKGGGKGSKDKSETGLERLRDSLATESEALETWRAEQLEKLREYRDAKMITEQEYNELEARIKQEHAERLAQIEASAMSQRMGAFRGALGDLSSLMQTENDKLFKVGKAAALAQAIVDGHQSAVAAWKHGMNIGGPPVAAAFTAASLARTGAMISQIASASPRGTSAGGGAGGGAAAAAPAAAPLQVMLSGIGQNDFIRGSQLGELLDRLQDEAGDRGYRLMVAQ